MNTKEKAKELVDRYYWMFGDGYLGSLHIQCALIAVDEILKTIQGWSTNETWAFWQEVKKEIDKL